MSSLSPKLPEADPGVINYLLYLVYVLFFGCLFLTDDLFLAYHFFLYVVAPVALAPVWTKRAVNTGPLKFSDFELSPINPLQTVSPSASPVFCGIFIFGLVLVFSSSVAPGMSFAWFQFFFSCLLAVMLFVLITARLTINFDDFTGAFFTFFCLIAASSAAINIFLYFSHLTNIGDFRVVRMAPVFGLAPDHYFTTGAFGYAIPFAGSVGLFLSEDNKIRRITGFIAGIVLFIAISLTQSRGPLFASLIAIFFAGLAGRGAKERWWYLLTPVIAVSIFLLVPEFSKSLIERADNHRLEIWKKFLDFALERPVFGYGERLTISLEISDGESLGHAHNIFLSALMRGGLLAFASIACVYAIGFLRALRWDLVRKDPVPLAVIMTVILSGLVDFDQIIMIANWQWATFWLSLGLVLGVDRILDYEREAIINQTKTVKK